MLTSPPSPRDLRGAIAQKQFPLYKLGALVDCHPARLGQYLAERLPMPPELAERIDAVLRQREP
jgi:hypothetical protein